METTTAPTAVGARRLLLFLLGGAGAILAALAMSSPAFACIPSQTLNVSPNQGAAGSSPQVVGGGWMGSFSSDTDVTIYWVTNDASTVLADDVRPAKDGTWARTITIPASAEPGVYVINARQLNAAGEVSHSTSQAYEVTAAAASGSVAPASTEPAPAAQPAPAAGSTSGDRAAPATTSEAPGGTASAGGSQPATSSTEPNSATAGGTAPAMSGSEGAMSASARASAAAPDTAASSASASSQPAPAPGAAADASPGAAAGVPEAVSAATPSPSAGLSPAAVAALKGTSEPHPVASSIPMGALAALKATADQAVAASSSAALTASRGPLEGMGTSAVLVGFAGMLALVAVRTSRSRRLGPGMPA